MKIRVSHNLLHHGYRSLIKAMNASIDHDTLINLHVNKNVIDKPYKLEHSLTISGNGLRKTVIYLANNTLMLHLVSGNLKFKNLTIILGAYSRLLDADDKYQGQIEFDHVRIYHEPHLKKLQNYPAINLISDNGHLLNVKLDCFDCQLDCLYAGIRQFEFTHCLIGNLWGKTGLIGSIKGLVQKTVLSNFRIEALEQGQISLYHDTFHGLLSFGGHIKMRYLTMQAPKAPTGWIVRRRLHKQNRVYKLPDAVDFIMANSSCYVFRSIKLITLIDCQNVQEDGNSFKIWRKNAHLQLNPRWFAMKNSVILLSDCDLTEQLNNQFIDCKVNGKVIKSKIKMKPLQKTHSKPAHTKSVHKASPRKPVNKRPRLNRAQMMTILVNIMKTDSLLSSGAETSNELTTGIYYLADTKPYRSSVIAYLQKCLDSVRIRTDNESVAQQNRDQKTITYDDAHHVNQMIMSHNKSISRQK